MTAETNCVWRTVCPALIRCAAAGRCLSIPKDLADTQTEVRPSNQRSTLQQILAKFKEADEERYRNQMEFRADSLTYKAEGDMYGYNFHAGMDAGANWVALYFFRVQRELEGLIKATPDETSAPVWKRMRSQVPANGTWIWWDYGKGPMLQRAQDFASEDDGYWVEATPPLRSLGEPK